MTLHALEMLPSSLARLSRPTLCRMMVWLKLFMRFLRWALARPD